MTGGRQANVGFVAPEGSSGTKSSTPLIATPQSVSVVPREAVDALQAQTLGEAVRCNAGIRSEAFGNDQRADFLLIRGSVSTAFFGSCSARRSAGLSFLRAVRLLGYPATIEHGLPA